MLEPLELLIQAARSLGDSVGKLKFRAPVAYVYNPLDYAWGGHEVYLRKFGLPRKRVLFLGMNPGPFGMMQTGVPFGEVKAAREWLGLTSRILSPARFHPKRPIEGFDCARSEVSGRRLWGLFADRFGAAKSFFQDHFVANYCPLAFLDEGGRNLTPDKLLAAETDRLFGACDEHLRSLVAVFEPEWVIGVGGFAEKRALAALEAAGAGHRPKIGKIPHPSPASPAANRDWAGAATEQLRKLGVW